MPEMVLVIVLILLLVGVIIEETHRAGARISQGAWDALQSCDEIKRRGRRPVYSDRCRGCDH